MTNKNQTTFSPISSARTSFYILCSVDRSGPSLVFDWSTSHPFFQHYRQFLRGPYFQFFYSRARAYNLVRGSMYDIRPNTTYSLIRDTTLSAIRPSTTYYSLRNKYDLVRHTIKYDVRLFFVKYEYENTTYDL